MAEPAGAAGAESSRGGYARAATSGTRWTTAQGVINKIATALAMYIVARAMSPAEFGMASIVIVASGFVMVLPIFVMGDVLITHQHHLATISRAAWRVTLGTALALSVAMMVTAPLIASWYDQYPFLPMALLLAASGLRPIAEALTVFPLTRLRMALRYRDMAVINGAVQLGTTGLTVAWALAWPGAAAIVVPQIIGAVVRAGWFALAARDGRAGLARMAERVAARHPALPGTLVRRVFREFSSAALAQYVHTVVGGLPLMVASHYVTETVIGQFSFAFSLANQASAILSYQLSTVLQPIFGRLKSDPVRQVAGFMRVVSLMSALAVPIALLQAALAEPLFLLVFGEKWLPAIPFFVAFSFGQAFYFMTAPAMALLKAQGRFGTFFVWQAAHAVACLALFPAAAMWWSAAGVAWADAALWLVSVPLAVSLGARTVGMRLPAVLKVLFASWLTAGPIALAAWAAWRFMPGTPTVAALVALLGVGPVALLLSILAVRITQPAVAGEIAPFMRRVFTRVPVLGTPLANWFAPGEP